MPKKILDHIANFWSKIDVKGPDDCWLWKSPPKNFGYGQFFINRKPIYAHRFAYILKYGELKPGELVCHICDTPLCCNWKHLFAGTQMDNIIDKLNKDRQCKGEQVSGAKLTGQKVIKIRKLYATKKYTQLQLGNLFDCNRATISDIIRYKNWKHV